jgi:hypothetical protein
MEIWVPDFVGVGLIIIEIFAFTVKRKYRVLRVKKEILYKMINPATGKIFMIRR